MFNRKIVSSMAVLVSVLSFASLQASAKEPAKPRKIAANQPSQTDADFEARVEAARQKAQRMEEERQIGAPSYLAVIGALNMSDLGASSGYRTTTSPGFAPNFGLGIHGAFSNSVGGELALTYNTRNISPFTESFNFLQINPEVKFWPSSNFAAGVGMYYAIPIGIAADLADALNIGADLGITASAQGTFEMGSKTYFLVGGKILRGLTNLNSGSSVSVYFTQFSLNLGLGLRL